MTWKEWPLGKLPKDWMRIELEEVKAYGYDFEEPRDLVTAFESRVARFAGAPYAIAVDSCTNAIYLSLMHHKKWLGVYGRDIFIPSRCYLSIPMMIKHAGYQLHFRDRKWSGGYQLEPLNIWDFGPRFTKGMYQPGTIQCLSFQIKKILPIGKGGIILTDDADSVEWFRQASFEGRHMDKDRWNDVFEMCGYNMYMTPEDAARGLILFHKLMDKYPDGVIPDMANQDDYPDLSTQKVFK